LSRDPHPLRERSFRFPSTRLAMGCGMSAAAGYVSEDGNDSSSVATSRFHQEHVLGRKLGEGSFGAVYAAKKTDDDTEVAVKIIDTRVKEANGRRGTCADKKLKRAVVREVSILMSLPVCSNVIRYHNLYHCGELALIVMELCSTGVHQMLTLLPELTEASLQHVFRDMVAGVAACHSARIVHRDIKPDNFLASANRDGRTFTVKLCDFGLACKVRSTKDAEIEGVFGTPPYMAPEMLSGKPYSAAVDVWALGVVAYVFMFGLWPYMPAVLNGPSMKNAILVGSPRPRFRGKVVVSAACTAWVASLLCRDPAGRPTAQEALRTDNFIEAWDSSTCLAPAIESARLNGAFELPGRVPKASSDLERIMATWELQRRAQENDVDKKVDVSRKLDKKVSREISDVSTISGSETPTYA